MASVLVQRAAAANRLDHKVYKRLNLGLGTWAALSLVLSLLKYNLFKPPAILCAPPPKIPTGHSHSVFPS
jgi:hypothetical protein